MNENQNAEVWKRIIRGKPLDDLGLGNRDGRIDLTGLLAPKPTVIRTFQTPVANVSELGGLTILNHITWKSLDFSGSKLKGLRFHSCKIIDCVFDECDCQDWRIWGTTVSDTSFRSADLRTSALGGIENGKINEFQKIDFIRADLRQTAYVSARFVDCLFKNTRLNKVNFQGSAFTDCSFEGELEEVCFNRNAFRGEALPPNEMLRVDFTRARLRSVEFRGLDLKEVSYPNDPDHIVLNEYPQTLDRILEALRDRADMASRMLAADLGVCRKWAGPQQVRGVLNKKDLLETGGEEGLRTVLAMIEPQRG